MACTDCKYRLEKTEAMHSLALWRECSVQCYRDVCAFRREDDHTTEYAY